MRKELRTTKDTKYHEAPTPCELSFVHLSVLGV